MMTYSPLVDITTLSQLLRLYTSSLNEEYFVEIVTPIGIIVSECQTCVCIWFQALRIKIRLFMKVT